MNPALANTSFGHWITVGPHTEHARRCAGWIATAIDLYCDFASDVLPGAVTRTGPSKHDMHPLNWGSRLQRLLRRPCGSMCRDLWQRTCLRFWLATGNVYLYRQDSGGQTLALWPIATQHVTPLRNERTGLIGSLQITGHDQPIPYSKFIHVRRPNVIDPYGEGLSPISEHALSVELADSVDQVRVQAFNSPRRPNMMFASDLPLSDEDVQRNEARVMSKWGGLPGAQGRPMFLDSGLKLIGNTMLTPQEIDYLQTTRVTREELMCGIYRIPMLLAGFSEPGQPPSEGLIAGAATLFAHTAVDPCLRAIYGQLVEQLADDPNIEARIPSTAPLNRNQDRADEAVDRRECIRSVNEIREARGLAPHAGPWASNPQWRPEHELASYTSDPAPNSQPSDRGTTPPGPKPTSADTLDAPTAGEQ